MSAFQPNWLNSTETMAERAWRYGEAGERSTKTYGIVGFADGSALYFGQVDTARSLRARLDQIYARHGVDLRNID